MGGTGFVRKKVESLTLGEYLTKVRTEARVSIEDVAHYTKIQLKYLESLEQGDYRGLPADVYVKGFLRSYAAYLGIPDVPIIKLYQREKGIQQNIKGDFSEPTSAVIEPIQYQRFTVTSRMIVSVVVAVMILSGFAYLYRQVEKFVATPQLTILSPINNSAIESNTVTIEGLTEPEAQVIINQQPIMVNEGGQFRSNIVLQPGFNTIIVTARNKFEKEITKSISLEAKFSVDMPDTENPNDAQADEKNEIQSEDNQ